MIEITKVKERFPKKDFVQGRYIGDQKMPSTSSNANMDEATILINEEFAEEFVSRGLPENIEQIIHEDAEALRSYEKSQSKFEGCCGCTTAIGKPATSGKSARQRVFDSGLKVIQLHTDKISVEIPREILNACDELQEHVGHNEFSIVCKGKWGDGGTYILENVYKVPKQKVEGAAVDYDNEHVEQLKLEGYNTVIHSHPFKSDWFSSSDQETINSHFECSVLYSLKDFTAATVAITPVPGVKLIAKGDPVVEGLPRTIPKTELDNIEKKPKVYNQYNYNTRFDGDFGRDFRGSGKFGGHRQNSGICNDSRNVSVRQLAREASAPRNRDMYTFDPDTNTFHKILREDDKKSSFIDQRSVRVNEPYVHQVPSSALIGANVFSTTESHTKVFRTNDKSDIKHGKKNGKKKENQPKDIISM